MMNKPDQPHLNEKLNLETARIPWHELQTHFARGAAVYVAPGLDLINIACLVAADNSAAVTRLMQEGKIGLVTEAQAQQFWRDNPTMWAVVVAPWVLLQPAADTPHTGGAANTVQ